MSTHLGKCGFLLRCIWRTFFPKQTRSVERKSASFFPPRWCLVFDQTVTPTTRLWSRSNPLYPGYKQEFYPRSCLHEPGPTETSQLFNHGFEDFQAQLSQKRVPSVLLQPHVCHSHWKLTQAGSEQTKTHEKVSEIIIAFSNLPKCSFLPAPICFSLCRSLFSLCIDSTPWFLAVCRVLCLFPSQFWGFYWYKKMNANATCRILQVWVVKGILLQHSF